MDKISRMRELNELLAKASQAYYNTGAEIMSDHEYDALYDELEALEKETGVILNGSRTQQVGYEVASSLKKVKHPSKMLSLEKTKSVDELAAWLADKKGFLSWKLDGLTLVLTYSGGKLVQAVTRGNGETGEEITQNARHIIGIPASIPFTGELVVRGESLMKYSDFERVNAETDEGSRYKNPRNLCVGTVRNLDSRVTAERNINFFAFNLVSADGYEENSFAKRLEWLSSLGFQTVYGKLVDSSSIRAAVQEFADTIGQNEFPSDGLVLTFDDVAYGLSLGQTAHAPRNGIAFKWRDETADTTLREVEWSASRTGLLNPVAIFDPVELEGTTVSRALVHNLSIVKQLRLGIGDTLTIYKANMIIPQVLENKTESGSLEIPNVCPVCGAKTEREKDTADIKCTSPNCPAQLERHMINFVGRDAMDIKGFGATYIMELVHLGYLKDIADIYDLKQHREELIEQGIIGKEKNTDKLLDAIEKSKQNEAFQLLTGFGIPNVGKAAAKTILKHFGSIEALMQADMESLQQVADVGEVTALCIRNYFQDENNCKIIERLKEAGVNMEMAESGSEDGRFDGLTFVITGTLPTMDRKAAAALIEAHGGKVSGSVSKKTNYLLAGENAGSKLTKANDLGVSVISEEELQEMLK